MSDDKRPSLSDIRARIARARRVTEERKSGRAPFVALNLDEAEKLYDVVEAAAVLADGDLYDGDCNQRPEALPAFLTAVSMVRP